MWHVMAGNTEGGSGKVGKAAYRIKQDTKSYEKERELLLQHQEKYFLYGLRGESEG